MAVVEKQDEVISGRFTSNVRVCMFCKKLRFI